jgi:uncharacterized membrane protein YgcG
MKQSKRVLAVFVSGSIMLASIAGDCATAAQPDTPALEQAAPQPPEDTTPVVQPSANELDQLVAPIALYPDPLVAQILAAATHPAQVVEAELWMQQHTDLKGDALARAVDTQAWDPSVKALTQFPSVLEMMDKNLAWTSSLGDAYMDGEQSVFDAMQVLRQRAQQAGNLESTPQESVTTDGQTISIAPTDPDVVYVPEYDPWDDYGTPLEYYPGWYGVPGLYVDGPGIVFGPGIGIGVFGGFGWGWNHWGTDWHRHGVMHDHDRYVTRSPIFINHDELGHRHPLVGQQGAIPHTDIPHVGFPYNGSSPGRGLSGGAPSGIHSSTFGGFDHGGVAHGFSARGGASVGGGFHGGGGGTLGEEGMDAEPYRIPL